MTDRKGYRFPLMKTRFSRGCEITVLGALPTDLSAFDADRRALRAGKLLVFTVESLAQQLALVRRFAQETIPPATEQTTAGHWLRGVE